MFIEITYSIIEYGLHICQKFNQGDVMVAVSIVCA